MGFGMSAMGRGGEFAWIRPSADGRVAALQERNRAPAGWMPNHPPRRERIVAQ